MRAGTAFAQSDKTTVLNRRRCLSLARGSPLEHSPGGSPKCGLMAPFHTRQMPRRDHGQLLGQAGWQERVHPGDDAGEPVAVSVRRHASSRAGMPRPAACR
jgi:hypothetical protein